MNQQRMQFGIGLLTLISGFALAAMIVWFGEFRFVLQPRKTFYFSFDRAPGAAPKIPVRRIGIRIGEVREVRYDEDRNLVILTVVIEGDNKLRQGDIPTLRRTLLGDTYLEIKTSGKVLGEELPENSTIHGQSPVDAILAFEEAAAMLPQMNKALSRIAETARQWDELGQQVSGLIENNEETFENVLVRAQSSLEGLEEMLDALSQTLGPVNRENLAATLENMHSASEGIGPLLEQSRATIEKAAQTLSTVDEVASNLRRVTKPLAERGERTIKNIDDGAQNFSLLVADLREITGQLRSQDGTFGRLIRDPTLYRDLDTAAILLVRNLAELEKVMQDLRVFADKIARHPGELGIQGVLSRDTGLKNVEPGTSNHKRGFFHR